MLWPNLHNIVIYIIMMSVLQGVSKTHLVMAWSKHKIIFLPIFNRSNFQCNEIMLTNESKRIWFCVWIIFRGTNITYPRNKLFFKQPVVNCVKISSRWNSSGQGFKANCIKQCKVHLSCENFVYGLKTNWRGGEFVASCRRS